jgi:hypothetical protein
MPESVTYVLGMECYPSVRKGIRFTASEQDTAGHYPLR